MTMAFDRARRLLRAFAFLAIGLCGAAEAQVPRYQLSCQDCDVRTHAKDQVTAINAAGAIVGRSGLHAVLYDDGVATDLGTLGGAGSVALGVNNARLVVGASTRRGRQWRAFLWRSGEMMDLGVLDPQTDDYSRATGIDNAGRIVGESRTAGDARHSPITRCVATSAERGAAMRDLGLPPDAPENAQCAQPAINGRGDVVLTVGDETWLHRMGYLLRHGRWTALGSLDTEIVDSWAQAMNDHGQVVGWSGQRAFLWADGVMTDLGTLPGGDSGAGAYAIDNRGDVVGVSSVSPAEHGFYTAGFIYSDGMMTDLNALLDPPGDRHWHIERAIAIDDGGRIAAVGYRDGVAHTVLLTPER